MENHHTSGSLETFDQEWRSVLAGKNSRYFIHPTRETKKQFDFFEWVKAQQISEIIQQADLPGYKVLEYGCGSAGLSLYLATMGFQSHICDLSMDALKVAQHNQQLNYPQVDFCSKVNSNVLGLPYADASFDLVMSFGLLEHFDTDALHILLQEVTRVLKPGGLFIADIIPGPERWNVRTFGILASYLGSTGFRFFTGRWKELKSLHQKYFEHYFESTYNDSAWAGFLTFHGLTEVQVSVCRPFPPLALPESLELFYVQLMERMLPFQKRFDQANNWLTRRWGWMYLARARKPGFPAIP